VYHREHIQRTLADRLRAESRKGYHEAPVTAIDLGQRSIHAIKEKVMSRKLSGSLLAAVLALGISARPAAADDLYTGSNLDRLIQVAGWFATVQDVNPADADFGGVRTDEGINTFYQSDTGKGIWAWSTARKLTGVTTFDTALANAWAYTSGFDPTGRAAFYQATYDSAWFLLGEIAYRHATNDSSFKSLAEQHFDWLVSNPLDWTINRNVATDGFAAGAMYRWANDVNDAGRKSSALDRGDAIRAILENDKSQLSQYSIEIHGAAGYWGVLESVFATDPVGRKAWVDLMSPFLPTSITIAGGYRYTYQAYLAGAYAVSFEYAPKVSHKSTQYSLVGEMMNEDDDSDGGIPRNQNKPSTEDNSWATGLLGFLSFDLLRPDCDVAFGPQNDVVVVPGDLVFDFGAANNSATSQTFFLVAFLKIPSSATLYLTAIPLPLPAKFAFVYDDFHFHFGTGSVLGNYELKVQSYNNQGKLLDEARLAFRLQ
jgi:hypothetical protein